MKEVETCIDLVAHKSCGLLDESLNLSIALRNNNPVLGGVFDLRYDDCALLAVVLVECN
jgi:hypothetical protein